MSHSLTVNEKGLLKLIQRSPQNAEGWACVSRNLWPMVETHSAKMKDLLEMKTEPAGEHYVRLTEAGKVVLKWL